MRNEDATAKVGKSQKKALTHHLLWGHKKNAQVIRGGTIKRNTERTKSCINGQKKQQSKQRAPDRGEHVSGAKAANGSPSTSKKEGGTRTKDRSNPDLKKDSKLAQRTKQQRNEVGGRGEGGRSLSAQNPTVTFSCTSQKTTD